MFQIQRLSHLALLLALLFKVGHTHYCTQQVVMLYLPLLQILVLPPSITVSSTDTVVYAGTTLYLRCHYTLMSPSMDTTPRIAVTWMVDSVPVNISTDRILSHGTILRFIPLATTDTGNYTCTVTVTASQTYGILQGEMQSVVKSINVEGI